MISNICEAFTCTPEEAKRQNFQEVRSIIEYRMAKEAIEMFNDTKDGAKMLNEHTGHRDLLLEIRKAQEE